MIDELLAHNLVGEANADKATRSALGVSATDKDIEVDLVRGERLPGNDDWRCLIEFDVPHVDVEGIAVPPAFRRRLVLGIEIASVLAVSMLAAIIMNGRWFTVACSI
ncbi:hypothetical protein C8R43DRAFT_965516 [Mycena crocata]|nr:hypothetical protein C8R43DRAFT_965516 [Mycena crocata]